MNELGQTNYGNHVAGRYLALLASTILFAGCSQETPDTAPIVRPVKIMEISDLGGGTVRQYPGFIRAAESAEVSFEVAGRIIKLDAREGIGVKAGAILAVLDDTLFVAEFDVARTPPRRAGLSAGRLRLHRLCAEAVPPARSALGRSARTAARGARAETRFSRKEKLNDSEADRF